jgi:hypothetical protein
MLMDDGGTLRFAAVIASEAKQSRIFLRDGLDCFVAFAPRNDGKNFIDGVLARAGDLPVVPICRS